MTMAIWQEGRSTELARKRPRGGRWLCVALVGAAMLVTGCSTAAPLARVFSPFQRKTLDESTRQKVDNDPFPTAQQVGL
jgi:hypothetical protein